MRSSQAQLPASFAQLISSKFVGSIGSSLLKNGFMNLPSQSFLLGGSRLCYWNVDFFNVTLSSSSTCLSRELCATHLYTLKTLLSHRGGGFFNFRHSNGGLKERGLIREVGLLKKWAYSQSQMTRIYMIVCQFFYPMFCGFNMSQIHGFDTVLSQALSKVAYKFI